MRYLKNIDKAWLIKYKMQRNQQDENKRIRWELYTAIPQ